jgi:hypothetical protein
MLMVIDITSGVLIYIYSNILLIDLHVVISRIVWMWVKQ